MNRVRRTHYARLTISALIVLALSAAGFLTSTQGAAAQTPRPAPSPSPAESLTAISAQMAQQVHVLHIKHEAHLSHLAHLAWLRQQAALARQAAARAAAAARQAAAAPAYHAPAYHAPAYHALAPAPAPAPVSASGTVYSYGGLMALWESAGGSAGTAAHAACIAEHESGGRTWVVSPTDDWGLWQIHAGGYAMLNAYANAVRAIAMSADGTNWSQWTTAGYC